ncbi:hypothetical protein L6232_26715, partial [Shewanella sp. C31]|nr:hypothetical protein [Shewanella electrica]
NLPNLDPFVHDPPHDPGLRYSVPYLWGATGIAYREDLVQGPEYYYDVLFYPKAQVGPFHLLYEMRETNRDANSYIGQTL